MKSDANTQTDHNSSLFGVLPNGQDINCYTISNSKGMKMKVMEYGATIISLEKTLKDGKVIDLVLGFDRLEDYVNSFFLPSPPYFGATIGRYAGRIAKAQLDLGGTILPLNANSNGNTLHGGLEGWSQKVWKLNRFEKGNNPSIHFTYVSPDGEEGFPGELTITISYTLTEDNELIINSQAKTSLPTVLNVTHHSYFNLEGHAGTILNQELQVSAAQYLETEKAIPTGQFCPTADSAFDFRSFRSCPATIDNTFVLEENTAPVACLFSPKNKLKMTVFTNQPAVHIYVGGNCFNQLKGKNDANYHAQSGICFETQNYPDAPHHSHFPTAILQPDQTYQHQTKYQFQSL